MRNALIALVLPLAACAGPSQTKFAGLSPIVSLGTIDLAYKGDISRSGLPELQKCTFDDDATAKGQVDVHVQIYEVESEALQRLMGPKGIWMRAERVSRDTAKEALAQLHKTKGAVLISYPRLSVTRGNPANLVAYNSFRYVDSFGLKPMGSETVADPIIKDGRDGMQLTLTPAVVDEAGQCSVDVRLMFSTLQRPIPATTGKIPGTDRKIEIQTPMFVTQELCFEATLGADEALLIGPLAPMEGKRPVMIFLSANSVAQVPE